MDQLARPAGAARTPVLSLDQAHREPASSCVQRRPGAGHPTPDHQDVEGPIRQARAMSPARRSGDSTLELFIGRPPAWSVALAERQLGKLGGERLRWQSSWERSTRGRLAPGSSSSTTTAMKWRATSSSTLSCYPGRVGWSTTR